MIERIIDCARGSAFKANEREFKSLVRFDERGLRVDARYKTGFCVDDYQGKWKSLAVKVEKVSRGKPCYFILPWNLKKWVCNSRACPC